MIRIVLPAGFGVRPDSEFLVDVSGAATPRALLDALAASRPELRDRIRDPRTQRLRGLLRFVVCDQVLSCDDSMTEIPEAAVAGREPVVLVRAVAGG
jgi:hypothetical protein